MFMINKYPKRVPFHKAIYKNLLYHIRKARLYYKNGKQHKTALLYPEFPKSRSVMLRLLRYMDYNVTNNPNEDYQFLIAWEDTTSRPEYEYLNERHKQYPIPNIHCREIGKTDIDSIFKDIFGYSLLIDPLTFEGKALKKSELNGKHDGMVIDCPIAPEEKDEAYSYQMLINNELDADNVRDIRVPIVKGIIPFVYDKKRPKSGRFGTLTTFLVLKPTREMLSEEEEQKIIAYCEAMHLDYGELDVLRHNDDGRIFIVDVNNTPCLPKPMSKEDDAHYVKHISQLIDEKLIKPQAGVLCKK